MRILRILFLLTTALAAAAQEPAAGAFRYERKITLEVNADGRESIVFDFSPRDYPGLKKSAGDPQRMLKRFPGAREDCLLAEGSTAAFDDSATAVVYDRRISGAARATAGSELELPLLEKVEFITDKDEGGRTTFLFTTEGTAFGLPYRGRIMVILPPGSKQAAWDGKASVVRYTPPAPLGWGDGKLRAEVEVRDPLMTCVYKAYAQPDRLPDCWVARAAIRNAGPGAVRDLKVRFRIEGYSDWSDWRGAGVVVAGQTVVIPWYPVLDRKVSDLRATAPSRVVVEWSRTGGATESAEKPIQLLGGHEFQGCGVTTEESYGTFSEQWSRISFIAAWVTRDDAAVKEFAGMASRNASGAAANMGDEASLKLIQACYELMLLNEFVYKAPPGVEDPSIKFDVRFVQNVKFPRDVIRDKSGTCIDLAILQCAMYQTLGLRPFMALVPGHAFPVAMLENGTLVPVESTGIRGGLFPSGSATFQEAREHAQKTLESSRKEGTLILVDMWKEWSRGIASPELENLPADALQKWGITQRGPLGGMNPDLRPDADPSGFSGRWAGEITVLDAGKAVSAPALFTIQLAEEGRYRLFLAFEIERDGRKVKVEEEGVAENQDGQLVFQGLQRMTGGEPAVPGRGAARIADGKLSGKYGHDNDGFKAFTFERKK